MYSTCCQHRVARNEWARRCAAARSCRLGSTTRRVPLQTSNRHARQHGRPLVRHGLAPAGWPPLSSCSEQAGAHRGCLLAFHPPAKAVLEAAGPHEVRSHLPIPRSKSAQSGRQGSACLVSSPSAAQSNVGWSAGTRLRSRSRHRRPCTTRAAWFHAALVVRVLQRSTLCQPPAPALPCCTQRLGGTCRWQTRGQ